MKPTLTHREVQNQETFDLWERLVNILHNEEAWAIIDPIFTQLKSLKQQTQEKGEK